MTWRGLMLPTEINTKRLRLRRPTESDTSAIFKFSADTRVTRWLTWPTCTDIDTLTVNIEHYDLKWLSGEEFYWVIVIQKCDTVIGSIACQVKGDTANLGFLIDSDHWGEGFASEAAAALLGIVSTHEVFTRVVAVCDAENSGSARVLEKIGMSSKGIARKFITCPNLSDDPRDALIFACDCGSTVPRHSDD